MAAKPEDDDMFTSGGWLDGLGKPIHLSGFRVGSFIDDDGEWQHIASRFTERPEGRVENHGSSMCEHLFASEVVAGVGVWHVCMYCGWREKH